MPKTASKKPITADKLGLAESMVGAGKKGRGRPKKFQTLAEVEADINLREFQKSQEKLKKEKEKNKALKFLTKRVENNETKITKLKNILKLRRENEKKNKDDVDIKPEEEDKKDDEKKLDDKKDVKNVSLGEKLTISELDMIKRQFYDCWIVPAGAKKIRDLVVSIELKLDEDGNVTYSKLINNKRMSDSFFRAAAESAMRAVNHPDCKKLKVPKKKYDVWKSLILDFNPSIMFN